RLQETRAGVRGLGSVDPVELGRMADRLVHLQLHLLGVYHDGRDACWALVGPQERRRFLRDARRLTVEPEPFHVLPSGSCTRADVGPGIAPDLENAFVERERVDAAPALDDLLVDLGAGRRNEEAMLAERPDRGLGDLHTRVLERLFGAQAESDLVGERDR